jgi:23S rRNA (guanine745-N1)-methyltransferase
MKASLEVVNPDPPAEAPAVSPREPCSAHLACPVCGGGLTGADGSARCAEGHSFDYARSGYLNLTRATGGRARSGDTAAMIEARAAFLGAGHYEPIAAAVAKAAIAGAAPSAASMPAPAEPDAGPPATKVLAEIGSGTGYYLAAVTGALRERALGPGCAVGIDLSKAAAAHAARRHPDLRFVVADVEAGIPLRDAGADVVLSVFSPRPGGELGRVVRPGGELVVAFAGDRHLGRLRERLRLMDVHEGKLERLSERLEPWFDPVSAEAVEYEVKLGAEDARHLALMGPNAWHGLDPGPLDGGHSDLVSVVVARFRRSAEAGPGAID